MKVSGRGILSSVRVTLQGILAFKNETTLNRKRALVDKFQVLQSIFNTLDVISWNICQRRVISILFRVDLMLMSQTSLKICPMIP